MVQANLSIVQLDREDADSVVTVRVGTLSDRFFPPLLAARLMLDVRGLVHQSCFSRPLSGEAHGAKAGNARMPRRWAFAQEIYSNEGRGTESGHFLEHLTLEMALGLMNGRRARKLAGETIWDWSREPETFRIRFQHVDEAVVRRALALSAEVLSQRDYRIDLGPAAMEASGVGLRVFAGSRAGLAPAI